MIRRWLKSLIDYLFGEYLLELKTINKRLASIQILLKQQEITHMVERTGMQPLQPISGINVFPGGT